MSAEEVVEKIITILKDVSMCETIKLAKIKGMIAEYIDFDKYMNGVEYV